MDMSFKLLTTMFDPTQFPKSLLFGFARVQVQLPTSAAGRGTQATYRRLLRPAIPVSLQTPGAWALGS